MIPGTSTDKVRASRWTALTKPLAIVASFVLIVSTLTLGARDVAPDADAQVSGTWQYGWITDTASDARQLMAPMTPIDDKTLYGSSYGGGADSPFGSTTNGWVGYYATNKQPPTNGTVTLIANGNPGGRLTPTGQWMSTLAIDSDPYGQRGAKYAYMWSWAGDSYTAQLQSYYPSLPNYSTNTIYVTRTPEGSRTPEVMPVPSPSFFNNNDPTNVTAFNYWSGGEIIQSTGEIFFSGGECSGINRNFRMMILDPDTLKYNFSGRIQPKAGGDDIFGTADGACGGDTYVASDMALDAKGQAYILVGQTGAVNAYGLGAGSRMWLVRVEPNENGPWTYNLVTPLTANPAQTGDTHVNSFTNTGVTNMVYGMAFYEGILYATVFVSGGALLAINVMTSQVTNVGPLRPTYVQDMASGQTAYVIEGVVYNDVEGNGSIAGNQGIGGQRVALYMKDTDGKYIYQNSEVSGASGDYSFLVGGQGDYIIRLVEPKINNVNATQTWASGGGSMNTSTAICYNQSSGTVTTEDGAPCAGAVQQPHDDADLPTSDSAKGTDKGTQPADMSYYTEITITSDREVVDANFAITTRGSYGDSSVGPTTGPTAPAHISGVDTQVWLGETLGSYDGPANNNTAHNGSDDGVFVRTVAGDLPMTDNAFVAGQEYDIVGVIDGDEKARAVVKGWNTPVGTAAPTTWNAAATWTPTVAGDEATGKWKATSSTGDSGQMHFRAQVSTVDIAAPTNSSGAYYSTNNWVTPGEIEDYALKVDNFVYRPAARTEAGTGNFTVAGVSFPDQGTDITVATGITAKGGTRLNLTATVPSNAWTVSEVNVMDTNTGEVYATPTATASGNNYTFEYLAVAGQDVIIEVVFAPAPDPTKSYLTMEPEFPDSQVTNGYITATATIRDAQENLLPNVTVYFSKVTNDITLSEATCKTDDDGVCSVTVTTSKAGTYNNEVSAKVLVGGTQTNITDSPATVKFVAGDLSCETSWFKIDPVATSDPGTWKKADDTEYYTGTLYARDESDNIIEAMDVSAIQFTAPTPVTISSPVTNNGDGSYSATFKSTKADPNAMAGVTVGACSVKTQDKSATELPIPFKAGEPVTTCAPSAPQCSTFWVDPDNDGGKTKLSAKGVATGTALITDYYGNPVEGVDVAFTLNNDIAMLTNPTATGPDGEASVTVTGQKAGTTMLSAKINNQDLENSPWQITYEVGGPDPDESTFEVEQCDKAAAKVIANGTECWKGIWTARDAQGDLITSLSADEMAKADWIVPQYVTKSDVKKDDAGKYWVEYTSKVANSYKVSFEYNGSQVDNEETITFAPGPKKEECVDEMVPPREGTGIWAEPPSTSVGSDSVIKARVTDEFCNPIPGESVSFTLVAGSSATFKGATTATTNDDGIAQATITDNVAETAQVNATSGDIRFTSNPDGKNAPVSVEFTVGDIDPTMSLFTVEKCDPAKDKVIADNVECWKGIVTPKDSLGNTVSPSPAQLSNFNWGVYKDGASVKNTIVTISDAVATNPADGTYYVTYRTEKSGDYTVDLNYGTPARQIGNTEPISFFAGPFDASKSSLTVTPAEQVVGINVLITVTARDKFENPISGLTSADILVNGRADTSGNPNMEISPTVQMTTDGVYTFNGEKATAEKADWYTVRGTVNGVDLLQTPRVRFIPAGVDKNTSYFRLIDNGAMADGTSRNMVRAYAMDAYGNPVANAPVSIDDITTNSAQLGKLMPRPQTGTTGNDGTVDLYYTSTVPGMYTIDGFIGGNTDAWRPADGSGQINTLYFDDGGVDSRASQMIIDKESPQTVGTDYVVTAKIMTKAGGPASGKPVQFSLTPATTGATLSDDTCETGPEGTCSIRVSSTTPISVSISAEVSDSGIMTQLGGGDEPATKSSPQTIAWRADEMCVGGTSCLTRAVVTMDNQQANGMDENKIMFYAYDRFDNPLSGLEVTSTADNAAMPLTVDKGTGTTAANGQLEVKYRSTMMGAHQVSAQINGRDVPTYAMGASSATGNGHATITFGTTPVDASKSWLEILPDNEQAVGSTFTVRANLRDRDDRPAVGQIDFSALDDLTFVGGAQSCTSDTTGTCTVQVTSTKAGTYDINGRVNSIPVRNSPVQATFVPGAPCVAGPNCGTKVEVTTNGVLADNLQRDIATVTVTDSYGNPIQGADITSTARDAAIVTVQPTTGTQAIQPTGPDGKTTIWYTSTTKGTFLADVRINGSLIPPGSPVELLFIVEAVSAANSSYVVTPAGPLTVGRDASSSYTVTATARDVNGILLDGIPVMFEIAPAGPTTNPPSQQCITSNAPANLGTCSITVSSTVSGSFTLVAKVTENNVPTEIKNSDTNSNPTDLVWRSDVACVDGCTPDPSTPESRRSRVEVVEDNALANDSDQDKVRVYVFDKWGNATLAVVTTTPSEFLNAQPNIGSVNEDGYTTIWYTSPRAGAHTAIVTVDGKGIKNSPATLNFVAGAPCVGPDCPEECADGRPGSRIQGAAGYKQKTSVSAGDTTPVRALITDAFCNPLPGQEVTFSHDSDNATIAPATAKATTDNTGWAQIQLTDTVAELVKVEGAISTGTKIHWGSPAEIEFGLGGPCVGPLCPEVCDDGREGSRIWGDEYKVLTTRVAGQPATVNARVTDINCNPIPGVTVNFSKTPVSPSTFDPTAATGVTNDDGLATIVLNDKKAETVNVSGTVGGVTIYWGNPAAFKFTAGRPAVTCTMPDGTPGVGTNISADPTSADVGGNSEITAYVTDEFCNPVEGASVAFAVTGSATFMAAPTVVTGEDGNAKIRVTDEVAEQVNVTGIVDGTMAIETGSPAQVTFVPGVLDPTKSTFTVAKCVPTATKVLADGEECWKGTVAAFDSRDNPLPGLTTAQLGMIQWNAPAAVSKSAVVDNGNATYSIQYTSTVADTYTVNAMYNSNPVRQIGSDESITFSPGPPCIDPEICPCPPPGRPGSGLTVTPTSLTIDDEAAVSVLITDAFCNPVPGVAVTMSVNRSAVLAQTTGTTNADGLVETTLSDRTAETVTVHAAIPAGTVPRDTDVTFNVGALDPNMSDFLVYKTAGNRSPDKVRADGVESWTGELIPKDQGGNLITTPLTTQQLALFAPQVASTVTASPNATRTDTNTYTWKFTSHEYGQITAVDLHHDNSRIPHPERNIDFTRAVAPVTPDITSPEEGDEINTLKPTFTGENAEPGSIVKVKDEDGNVLCQVTARTDGTWSCTPARDMTEGPHSVVVTATDSEGNESAPSDPVNFNLDVTPPNPPEITSPEAGDQINTQTPTVTGTSDEPGSRIKVKDKNGNVVCETTVANNGTWSCTTSTLPEGQNVLTATATDPAGNESRPSTPVPVNIDVTPPRPPVITEPTDGDDINTQTPTVTGTGGEPGSKIQVKDEYDNVVCTVDPVPNTGRWSCVTSPLAEGERTLTATATDPAGNESDPSNEVTVNIDVTPPLPPRITSPTDGDEINTQTPTVTGRDAEPGSTVKVKDEDGNVLCTAGPVGQDGTWSCTTSTLPEGEHTLTATATDPAGNESPNSTPVNVNIDVTPPAAPVITSPRDNADINTQTPVVSGTGAEPGSTVKVKDENGNVLCTVPNVPATGEWSCTTSTLPEGPHTLTATATDPAGNESRPSAPVRVKIDVTAPDAPRITSPTDGDELNTQTPTVSGDGAEAGSTVKVKDEYGNVLCTVSPVPNNGRWSCTTSTLPEGPHTLTATSTDAAGNESEESNPVDVNIDVTAPDAPEITSPADGDAVNTQTPRVSGEGAEPGSTVKVKDGTGKVLCTATAGNDGSWACTTSTLPEGNHTLTATATDPAGNESEASAPVRIEVDVTPPAKPIVDPTNGSKVTGKAEPGSKVNVKDGAGNPVPGCTDITVSDAGTFVCTPTTPITPGDTITVTATDRAGNVSPEATATVKAISINITHAKRYRGEEQIVTGYNFNPGEKVNLTVYSDPFNAGTGTANPDGTVTVKFTIPQDMDYTTHNAQLTGEESGNVSGTFDVISRPAVPTGGTTLPGSYLPIMLMALGALIAFAGARTTLSTQRNK